VLAVAGHLQSPDDEPTDGIVGARLVGVPEREAVVGVDRPPQVWCM